MKTRYFAPGAKVWVHSATLSDRYPGVIEQRQSGVYRVKFVEAGDVGLVKIRDVSERRA